MTDSRPSLPLALAPLVIVLALAAACGRTPPGGSQAAAPAPGVVDEALLARARQLAKEILIVDTHVDVPYRIAEASEPVDVSQASPKGDFDYPRAVAGGLDAPFMSIYVPASFQKTGGAKAKADELIDLVEGFATQWPDKFALAVSPAMVRAVAGSGRIALPMGMENGAPVEDDLANLAHFHARGIRYITLTHGENNQICDSSYAEERTWQGLSPFGREVVGEMNRLGILVDVSHVSDEAFFQTMEATRAPAIASHSSCRHFTPGWERNMSDEMIVRLAANGGVIQINFGSGFLTEAAQRWSDEYWAARGAYFAEKGIGDDHPDRQREGEAFKARYTAEKPFPYADVTDVVAHVDRVVKLTGIDHVGLGSDFDGVGDTLPTGLKSVADYPNLIAHLLAAGYTEDDVRKICGENLLRVWAQAEQVARDLQAAG